MANLNLTHYESELGLLEVEQTVASKWLWLLWGLSTVFMALWITLLVITLHDIQNVGPKHLPQALVIIGGCAAFAFSGPVVALRRRAMRLRFYANGVVVARGKRTLIRVLWNEVAELYVRDVALSVNAVPTPRQVTCFIKTTGGKTHRIDPWFRHMDENVKRIETHIYPRLRRETNAQLLRGETVKLGHFALNHQGIVYKRNRLLWAETVGAYVERGTLHIQSTRWRSWESTSYSNVPNAPVLLELIAAHATGIHQAS